jgi:hypothetical protein
MLRLSAASVRPTRPRRRRAARRPRRVVEAEKRATVQYAGLCNLVESRFATLTSFSSLDAEADRPLLVMPLCSDFVCVCSH